MKDTDTHLLVEVVHLCTFLLALQCRQTAIKDMGRLGSYSTFNYYQHNIHKPLVLAVGLGLLMLLFLRRNEIIIRQSQGEIYLH